MKSQKSLIENQNIRNFNVGNHNVRNNKFILIVSVILSLFILLFSTMTASSSPKGATSDRASYYHDLEKKHIQVVRELMNEEGFINAGVTMNYCMGDEGERIYTVKLHHNRFEDASLDKTQAVIIRLEDIPFEDGEVLYEII